MPPVYDFQERMADGRATAKRNREHNTSPYECFGNERQRFASMSDDDWHAREADEADWAINVGSAVDATDPVPQPEKEKRAVTKKSSTKLPTNQARYRASDKPMSALQYRAACNKLGITANGSAKVLGISRASAHRYAAGQWDVPETVAKALRQEIELRQLRAENERLRALVALGTTNV